MYRIVDTLTVCDIKPNLAEAFAEELSHVKVSLGLDVEINSCERNDEVAGADLILISAGKPRQPGVKMSRRDLSIENGKIVKYISEITRTRNPQAKYVVITNPVDSMAMVCKKYTNAEFVISTGTNLESLRMKSKIANLLNMPVSKVKGWVGGEHGASALTLWSTVKINDISFEFYITSKNKEFEKGKVDSYVKEVSTFIVNSIGGTEYGPAVSFRDIVSAIVKDSYKLLSVATPMKFDNIDEPVFVSVPIILGSKIAGSLFKSLFPEEKKGIIKAANDIYNTYKFAIDSFRIKYLNNF